MERKILTFFFPQATYTSAYGKVLYHAIIMLRMHVQNNFWLGTALHLKTNVNQSSNKCVNVHLSNKEELVAGANS